MKFTPIPTLQSDLQQLRQVPALRLRLFGRSFGPAIRASELRLSASEDGRLRAQVRFGLFWLKMPASLLEPIVERHFALDTKRALLASVDNPHVAAAQRPALRRANAMRRVPVPAAVPDVAATVRAVGAERRVRFVDAPPPALARHNSFAAVVETFDDGASSTDSSRASSVASSPSASSIASSPASSIATSPPVGSRAPMELDAYCDLMAQNVIPGVRRATYGTQVEARALADVTGRPIFVLSETLTKDAKGNTTASYGKGQFFFPSGELDADARPIAILLGGGGTGEDTGSNHYEPLLGAKVAALWTPELLEAAYALDGRADAVLTNFWTPAQVESARGQALADGNCLFDAVGQQLDEARGTPAAPQQGVARASIPTVHALSAVLREQTVDFLRANAKETVFSPHTLEPLANMLEHLPEGRDPTRF